MKDRSAIALLVRELENDLGYVREAFELRGRAVLRAEAGRWNDELDLMALGSCLHGIYSAFEAYFLRIAKFFENNVDREAWHRDLLDRMTLDLPGIRPALIHDKAVAEKMDELRRFRHLFRNLYKTRLSAAKLRIVNESAEGLFELFLPSHRSFVEWLRELGELVDRERA